MCGIAGIFGGETATVDRDALRRMADALAHRGPDGEGFHVCDGWPPVGLASRRLAIIDVEHGRQPMSTPDGRFTVVYNGELYNAAELRRDLERRGRRPLTRCDTELVLLAFAEFGPDAVHHLNGMFAFAAWDGSKRELFLARDRLGIKPLVYAPVAGGLVFASEPKALFASGLVRPELDLDALPFYLSSFVVADPTTFFAGVRRLPAGHRMLVREGGHTVERYWDCDLPEEPDQGRDAYLQEFRALLSDSVGRQLVSDVPVGVFLSSGVDSSLVGALAAEHQGALHSFTLGFEGSGHDERPAARALARRIGTIHSEQVVTAAEAAGELPRLLAAHDEPSQSLVQNHFVSAFARQQVTVALAGVGGDELFGAYPTHVLVNALARVDALPGSMRRAVVALAASAPDARVRRLARLASMPVRERVAGRLLHQIDPDERRGVLSADVLDAIDLDAPTRAFEGHWDRARGQHPLNRLLYVYVKTYLSDELLRALDSMSMQSSLEARVPLLDHRLVERAMAVPARHKIRGRHGKRLLHDVRDGLLPGTADPTKRGFSLPLSTWMRGPLAALVDDLLAPGNLRSRGVLDPAGAAAAVRRWRAGEERLGPLVMMMVTFELWAASVLDGSALPPRPAAVPVLRAAKAAEEPVDLSVIVVSFNTSELLREALASVEVHLRAIRHEVIVVDNASADGSADMVAREFPEARLIRNHDNVGFGRANNQAMAVARGAWFLLLNSDARLLDDSVTRVLEQASALADVGVAHCRLVGGDGRLQHSTYRFPSLRTALLEDAFVMKLVPRARRGPLMLSGYWDQQEERDVDWVYGAFMLVRRQVFADTGGFSNEIFMYGEELEWCRRLKEAGWRTRYFPDATVVHLEHRSTEQLWSDRERVAVSLARQQSFYEAQAGAVLGTLYALVRVAGGAARTAYYSARALVADAYAPHRDYARMALPILSRLLLRRPVP